MSSPFLSHSLSTGSTLVCFIFATVLGLTGLLTRSISLQKAACVAALLGFLCQTLALALGFHKSFGGGLSGGAYLQLLAWFTAFSALFLWLKMKQRAAIVFAAPLCAAFFAMSLPYMERAIVLPAPLNASFYFLHMGTLFIALALMAIAFIVSALFLILERHIKTKQKVKGFLQDMPALSALDAINGFCIKISFPLYTIGILSGLFRSKLVYGATFSGDPMEVLSLIIWALLAFVFHNRLASSWTGRKPALTMISIFLLSLFSLFVINTFMHSHHTFLIN
ncbi:MAG: cytochrome c biogenesis protein CcsA [Desulfovibrio sp.]|nr:cytochrome c biogenesis protein CcsA [Desulfovibrio sp.]